jgi:hypothetical protein
MCGRFVLSLTYRKLALPGCRMMRDWLSRWLNRQSGGPCANLNLVVIA